MSGQADLTEEDIKTFLSIQERMAERAKAVFPLYYASRGWKISYPHGSYYYHSADEGGVILEYDDSYEDQDSVCIPLNLLWDANARAEMILKAEEHAIEEQVLRKLHQEQLLKQKQDKEKAILAELIAKYGMPE